jgi:hypothetical protein
MVSFMRLSARRNVLLPQPEGPMNAVGAEPHWDRDGRCEAHQRALPTNAGSTPAFSHFRDG